MHMTRTGLTAVAGITAAIAVVLAACNTTPTRTTDTAADLSTSTGRLVADDPRRDSQRSAQSAELSSFHQGARFMGNRAMRFFKLLAMASMILSVPAMAANAEYTRENVAKVDCDKRCLM